MADLNIRNFPSEALTKLKLEAVKRGVTLRDLVIERLTKAEDDEGRYKEHDKEFAIYQEWLQKSGSVDASGHNADVPRESEAVHEPPVRLSGVQDAPTVHAPNVDRCIHRVASICDECLNRVRK